MSSNIDAMNSLIGKLMRLNTDRSLFALIRITQYLARHKLYVSDETCPLVLTNHKYMYMPLIQTPDDASQLQPKHVDRNWCCV